MTSAKAFLMTVQMDDTKIEAKVIELQKLKSMVTKITPTLTDTGGGSGSLDKFEKTMAKIVDLQNEINDSIDSYVNHKKQVSELLDKLSDPDQYKVLHERYILGKSFEQISCDMHMTYRNACYIHGKGLQAFQELLKTFQ